MNLYGNLSDEAAMAGMLYGMNPKTIVSNNFFSANPKE